MGKRKIDERIAAITYYGDFRVSGWNTSPGTPGGFFHVYPLGMSGTPVARVVADTPIKAKDKLAEVIGRLQAKLDGDKVAAEEAEADIAAETSKLHEELAKAFKKPAAKAETKTDEVTA